MNLMSDNCLKNFSTVLKDVLCSAETADVQSLHFGTFCFYSFTNSVLVHVM